MSGPVDVVVRADAVTGELARLWTSIGYDEINWTYTPIGRRLLATLGSLGDDPYRVRTHYMFNSGTGLGLPHWGSGNVYHEHPDGTPHYDFRTIDRVYDAIVEAGHVPIVELGFTPRALVPDDADERFPFRKGSPTLYGGYEAAWWSTPPRSFSRWGELVAATVGHCVARYGRARVSEWLWELWNEPDIGYWRGTVEEYCELYRVTAEAVRSVLGTARVGGPATTGDLEPVGDLAGEGVQFLASFLDYCADRRVPLDFVTFHTKGAYFDPLRAYLPAGAPPPRPQSPSMAKMLREVRASLREVAARPGLGDLESLADECDASVPAHLGRFDNANFEYRNTEYFPVFQCSLMKKLLDLEEARGRLTAATAWAFYIEGERCFEGTRSLLTYGEVEKPVMNAYRLLARLGRARLEASSTAAWDPRSLDGEAAASEEVDVLAARDDDGRVTALVWRHDDDQHRREPGTRPVRVRVEGLPDGAAALRHWRIDAEHGNAHGHWRAIGAPDYPGAAELEELKRRGALRLFEPERREEAVGGRLEATLDLPLPSVSLLELVPGRAQAGS